MEGVLLVPPERGTIIGRALWKPRFVVVGGVQKGQQTNLTATQILSTSRIQAANRASNLTGSTRGQAKGSSEGVFLSIYKSKDDLDPIQQHALTSITDCQIQNVAHRKQGPILPTLIINISPDPATDKLRKRRSSRTAGLTTTKEVHPTSLWFRPGDDEHTLQDWAKFIQPMIQTNLPDRSPLSPISPTSPSFTNPFAPRREFADLTYRPSSSNGRNWGGLRHQFSINTQSSRERPVTYSDCPAFTPNAVTFRHTRVPWLRTRQCTRITRWHILVIVDIPESYLRQPRLSATTRESSSRDGLQRKDVLRP